MIEFRIDARQLAQIADEFGASEQDLRRAFSAALSRTARALRTMARKALRAGLDLRAASVLRARLRLKRIKAAGLGAVSLWVGTNDIPASWLKGTPRETAAGATQGGRSFSGAFVGRGQGSGKRLIFRRRGAGRLPIEAVTVPVADEMGRILDDEVFEEAGKLIMKHLRAELRARTIYGVGRG